MRFCTTPQLHCRRGGVKSFIKRIYSNLSISTLAPALSECWRQPSPQLPHPAITSKQQRTFRKQQGQKWIFPSVPSLARDPAKLIFTFSRLASLPRINDICTQLCDLYPQLQNVITYFSKLQSTPQDKVL